MFNIVDIRDNKDDILVIIKVDTTKEFNISEIDKLILGLNERSFKKEPMFIPSDIEIREDDGFIDIHYLTENVDYPNDDLKDKDREFLTEDDEFGEEIGKNLFEIKFNDNILFDNILTMEYSTLQRINEKEKISSIFEIDLIKNSFVDAIKNLIY